jgi:hypothetical protein
MAEAIPGIEFTENNRGGLYIRCENYIYQIKTNGKQKALYRCPYRFSITFAPVKKVSFSPT